MGADNQLPHSTITGRLGNGKHSGPFARDLNAKLMQSVASADSPFAAVASASTLASAATHDVFRFRKSGLRSQTRHGSVRPDTGIAFLSGYGLCAWDWHVFLDVAENGRP
jgi:hypothetical protein